MEVSPAEPTAPLESTQPSNENASAEASSSGTLPPHRVQHIYPDPDLAASSSGGGGDGGGGSRDRTYQPPLPTACDPAHPSSIFVEIGMPMLQESASQASPFMQDITKTRCMLKYVEECTKFFEELSNWLDMSSHIIKSMPKNYIFGEMLKELQNITSQVCKLVFDCYL